MHPLISIVITLTCLSAILAGSAWAVSREIISGELARKSVHVGMGLLCLSFPWLFDSVLAVQALAAVAVLSLLVVRISKLRQSVGSALFSVERLSVGELLFPIAVAWLFTLGWDRPVLYAISLLLLTLADTAGALAGSKYGKKFYRTIAATKSLEGSLAFFVTAFICTALPLFCFTDLTWGLIVFLSLTVALFTMAVEGASGHGLDNLLIPIGAFLLLDYYGELGGHELFLRAAALVILLALLLFTHRQHTFDGGALLTALLFGFAAFTLGGLPCLLAAFLVFVRHLVAQRCMPEHGRVIHSQVTIIAVAIPSLFWLTLARGDVIPQASGQAGFIITQALTIAMLHSVTQKHLGKPSASLFVCLLLSLVVLSSALWLAIPPLHFAVALALSPLLAWVHFQWKNEHVTTATHACKLGILASVFSPIAMLPILL
ncbi:hypothetical protein JIN77_05730 [Verrucomicrobiaceae bacterium R5-34]|uniref:Phytol kinase n=1 Tax=Oceaniferula flava TaxID=2800421 RepID=A0AAE2VDN1_9BACT|nr:hypothetical protein [Oceaniferula flavus]MBK1830213.1 hypothetical protein [Verrucomicrobiaceae bacterium R5-34]MBK1854804.1 hypothetical protein [Oceaniferula flavus]MBM1136110.1 hypothetical protein [Oceaniferula flavus]